MTEEQDAELRTFEKHFEPITRISLATPMGNPFKDDCIWGSNNLFVGGSGVGKTERTDQESAKVALECCDVLLAQHPPEDMSGVPIPSDKDETGVVIQCIIGAIRRLNKLRKGVLFLDEVGNASRTTQGAALSLLTTRRIGDTDLAHKVRILLATNPRGQTTTGSGLLPAFANRTSHFLVKEDFEGFRQHILNEGLDIPVDKSSEDLEEIVKRGWSKHWSDKKALMLAFLDANRSAFCNQPKTSNKASGRAYPTPRTWENAHRCVAAARCLDMPPELDAIMIEGWVGEGSAIEWVSFASKADLPAAEDVLLRGWKIDTDRQDRTLAVVQSIRMFVLGIDDPDQQIDMAKRAWLWLQEVEKEGLIDMVTPIAQAFANNKLGRGTDPTLDKACEPIMKRIGKTGAVKFAAGSR